MMLKPLEIPVSLVRSMFIYDAETGNFFWKKRTDNLLHSDAVRHWWNKLNAGKQAFTLLNKQGYCTTKIAHKKYLAHRIAWVMHYGKWPDGEIDHINGDRADNRIANLRDVPRRINLRNFRTPRNNTSGAWGLNQDKKTKKWIVRISGDHSRIYVGAFASRSEAILARDTAALANGYVLRGE